MPLPYRNRTKLELQSLTGGAAVAPKCIQCGENLTRRFKEGQKAFLSRKYCCRQCYAMAQIKPLDQRSTYKWERPTEFKIWDSMIQRCENPKHKSFGNYGGRGIAVCQAWRDSYKQFFSDVGERPSPKHSIDRINNQGNYEPSNVRWASSQQQTRNSRRNRYITAFGRTQVLEDWASELGLASQSLIWRLDVGKWPIERALSEPRDATQPKRKTSGAVSCL